VCVCVCLTEERLWFAPKPLRHLTISPPSDNPSARPRPELPSHERKGEHYQSAPLFFMLWPAFFVPGAWLPLSIALSNATENVSYSLGTQLPESKGFGPNAGFGVGGGYSSGMGARPGGGGGGGGAGMPMMGAAAGLRPAMTAPATPHAADSSGLFRSPMAMGPARPAYPAGPQLRPSFRSSPGQPAAPALTAHTAPAGMMRPASPLTAHPATPLQGQAADLAVRSLLFGASV
jgi:hypothetical protein